MSELTRGLYEKVIDVGLAERVADVGERAMKRDLEPIEAGRRFARAIHDYLIRALDDVPEKQRPQVQLEICNRIVDVLLDELPGFASERDRLTTELLTAVAEETAQGARPSIPLSESALFVNATRERRIETELKLEISSSDEVDLLCPFLFWQGYRLLRDSLLDLLQRGGQLRVITSTYCKMTEPRVLVDLEKLGAAVKVSYETQSTRLHAKAWFFRRRTGYSTAFVGSSNLSKTALTSGLEWNVRLSQIENRGTLEEFEHAFENYWHDASFEPFDRQIFEERQRPDRIDDRLEHVFELRPYSFQQEILDRLAAERELHDRHQNLVVAATGTGKTVIAALDYKHLGGPERPSLLFLAHRKEILRQARTTFRHAVGDGSFGELWVDGDRPVEGRHVFASVQSLAGVNLEEWAADRFDVLIVDEFHHASEANRTYARLLEHLEPSELLGLTATPERTDGVEIKKWFGGRVTAEIRLWDAIDRGLLVPFQYFAVHDDTDLSQLAFQRGRYDTRALEGLYDGNDARAHLTCTKIAEIVDDPHKMRALGFCVGVGHARYMAAAFERAGLPARAVTGETSREDRARSIDMLKRGELRAIFAVDVFNEGVDIPEIDTLLFLRPTESAVLFTQQLGRGLRHSGEKRCLTVLDFVGRAHQKFRYDLRFRALTGAGRSSLKRQVIEGFPFLPAGCSIELDRESQDAVLENLRQGIATGKKSLLAELRHLGDVTLAEFLTECELELADIYRAGRTWSQLRRDAGLPAPPKGPQEGEIGRKIGRLIHIDDPLRFEVWTRLIKGSSPKSALEERLQLMLATSIADRDAAADPAAALDDLRRHPALIDELLQILELLRSKLDHGAIPFRAKPLVPLAIHARYSRDEIMAAFGIVRNGKLAAPQEGVVFDKSTRCDLLLVTLTKDEKDYSPTTLYRDYALAPDRFHWQSQNRASQENDLGRRHLDHETLGVTPLLFVRATKKDDRGMTSPYTFVGPARLAHASGERPINIEWELVHAMPGGLFRIAAVAAG